MMDFSESPRYHSNRCHHCCENGGNCCHQCEVRPKSNTIDDKPATSDAPSSEKSSKSF